MYDYLQNISDMILDARDDDLVLLRWLISYHSKSFYDVLSDDWVNLKREEMKAACRRHKIIDEETGENFSDLEYAQEIYRYGQSMIIKFANNETSDLSEYSVLLYIYTLAVDSNEQKNQYSNKNLFGKCLLKNIQSLCLELSPTRDSTLINGFLKRSSVDNLIFILYLWVADFGVLYKYNQKICLISRCNSYTVNADEIYKLIYKLPSKLKYFYNNPEHAKGTEEKIYNVFTEFLSDMTQEAVPFAPSIITIFFNSLLPIRIARADEPVFHYANLIREIDCVERPKKKYNKKIPQNIDFPAQEDSSFLKMLILPEDGLFIFDKNKKNRIESRFIEYEWTCFCNIYKELYKQAVDETRSFYLGWHRQKKDLSWYQLCISEKDIKYFEENINKYFVKGKIKVPTSKEYRELDLECRIYILKALKNQIFSFTFLYFEMFCMLVEKRDLFSNNPAWSADIALSIIHLNAFTKWYDAVLLHKGMDFSFHDCAYFFYLKMLTVYQKFKSFIVDISYVDNVELNKLAARSLKKISGKTIVNSKDIFCNMLNFFYDFADKKINTPGLINIFKTNSDQKSESYDFDGFNPIYQWIKLLDDNELKKTHFDEIVADEDDKKWRIG